MHVDSDFGGDPDDACALVMLLGWPGVEIVGITTNLEVSGQRAGDVLEFRSDPAGSPAQVATHVDVEGFNEMWLARIEAAAWQAIVGWQPESGGSSGA